MKVARESCARLLVQLHHFAAERDCRAGRFESARVFGWNEIGRRVAKAKADYDAKFVVASDRRAASQLAFALQDPTVECFEDKMSQFSFWLNKEQRKGQDAIILVDEPQSRALNSVIRPKFRSVELIGAIPITRLGKILTTYQVYSLVFDRSPLSNLPIL